MLYRLQVIFLAVGAWLNARMIMIVQMTQDVPEAVKDVWYLCNK